MFEDITNMVDKEKPVDVNMQFDFWDIWQPHTWLYTCYS